MEKNESYHTIKNLTLGQTEIEICIENIPTVEEKRNHLIKIYDVVNDIARKAEKRGVDTSKWFYTKKQLKILKQDPINEFI
jgi:hypothetical protein